ncbi:hypothetical protein GCM10023063_16430 [Arthrobacter methylotrophus]
MGWAQFKLRFLDRRAASGLDSNCRSGLHSSCHNHKASGSVSKTTDLLVCGEEGSAKWNRAKELGIKIVTPEEFARMLKDGEG